MQHERVDRRRLAMAHWLITSTEEYEAHWRSGDGNGDTRAHMAGGGHQIRIFAARASVPSSIKPVEDWCLAHFGVRLPVTNVKDFGMIELWDDRCIQVHVNTGRHVDQNRRRPRLAAAFPVPGHVIPEFATNQQRRCCGLLCPGSASANPKDRRRASRRSRNTSSSKAGAVIVNGTAAE